MAQVASSLSPARQPIATTTVDGALQSNARTAQAGAPRLDRLRFSVSAQDSSRLVWIGTFAAIFLLIAAGWYESGSPRSRVSASSVDMGLKIDHQASGLRLTWNPQAAEIYKARRGTLWINDGQIHKKVDLSQQQLSQGYALYVASSKDVNFLLEIRSEATRVVESIRSVLFDPNPVRVATDSPAEIPPTEAVSAERPIDRTPEQESPASALTTQQIPAASPAANREGSESSRQATSPEDRVISPKESVFPKEPVIVAERAADAATPVVVAVKLASTVPELPPREFKLQPLPSVDISYESEPKLAKPSDAHGIPVLRHLVHARKAEPEFNFLPARPVREVKPHIPVAVAGALPGVWRVKLRLTIDQHGRVSHVDKLSSDVDARLMELATSAVSHWDYQPGQMDGRDAASYLTVTFAFHNPPQME